MTKAVSTHPFEELTRLSHGILVSDLERNGNILSDLHKQSLLALVSEMTGYAEGKVSGRRAFSLGTGCGKTSAIIAWIVALYRLGLESIAVSVSASKVEALCDLKKALLSHGVPEHLIGIKHSYTEGVSMPSTGNEDRRYQLVTHARVRGGNDDQLFVAHDGHKRALMVYDESLFRSEAQKVSERSVRMELAALREYVRGRPQESEFAGLISYFEEAIATVSKHIAQQKLCPEVPVLLSLPASEYVERMGYSALLGKDQRWVSLRSLLELVGYPLRTMLTKQDGGLVCYRITVPPQLGDILILDASYPIRELVLLDKTIVDATPAYVRNVKTFNKVSIRCMNLASGRESMSNNFSNPYLEQRTVSRELIEVIKAVPDEKSVLIFTFKPRAGEVDIPETICRDLSGAGIDIRAKTPEGRSRINVLTWGDETSLNHYAHCEVVLLVGLLHLPCLDIASRIIAQQDDLAAPASNAVVTQMIRSEIAHSVYQAISRGSCRVVENGEAKGMEVYLFHKGHALQETLESIMPGVNWNVWVPGYATSESHSSVDLHALQIKEILDQQPEERMKIPTKEIRSALGLEQGKDSVRKMLDRAIERVCHFGEWRRQGQSLIRYGALFGC